MQLYRSLTLLQLLQSYTFLQMLTYSSLNIMGAPKKAVSFHTLCSSSVPSPKRLPV